MFFSVTCRGEEKSLEIPLDEGVTFRKKLEEAGMLAGDRLVVAIAAGNKLYPLDISPASIPHQFLNAASGSFPGGEEKIRIELVFHDDPAGKRIFALSAAQLVLAAACQISSLEVFSISVDEEWFHLDVLLSDDRKGGAENDFRTELEIRVAELISRKIEFRKFEVPCEEAIMRLEKCGNRYEALLARDEGELVALWELENFFSLGNEPRIKSCGDIRAFRISFTESAILPELCDGKVKKPLRISGLAFPDHSSLAEYLPAFRKMKERDHRVLNADLGLFELLDIEHEKVVTLSEKGCLMKDAIVRLLDEEYRRLGYRRIRMPANIKRCPAHLEVISDTGVYENYEAFSENVLEGSLLATKTYSSTLAHGITRAPLASIEERVIAIRRFYSRWSLDGTFEIIARPSRPAYADPAWKSLTALLANALLAAGEKVLMNRVLCKDEGPGIVFFIEDSYMRSWDMAELSLHREPRGDSVHFSLCLSIERLMALLVENFSGLLPFELAPVQVYLHVERASEAGIDAVRWAMEVERRLKEHGIRTYLSFDSQSPLFSSVPYTLLFDEDDALHGTFSVRRGRITVSSVKYEEFTRRFLGF